MLYLQVTSTDNSLNVNQEGKAMIHETMSVKIQYEKTIEDLSAYNAMALELMEVIKKHCPTATLPLNI